VFSKEEVKEFIVKYGKKWFFPDFTNKVTWYVATLGAGIIIAPTPFKVIFYNWLIDTFNLNLGNHFTLSEVSSNTADYWVGFGLIVIALVNNLFSKWLNHQNFTISSNDTNKTIDVDTRLFEKFLEVFPSNSRSACLLEQHDFGNSFDQNSLNDIDKFVYEWNTPENEFINPDLEKLKKELWTKSDEFTLLVSVKTSPTPTGFQSAVPDRHNTDWDWPDWVSKDVKDLNALSTVVFKLHQKFIKTARGILKC